MKRLMLLLALSLPLNACIDRLPPLDPVPAGALLAGHGQGPQNPEILIFNVESEGVFEGVCAGYPGESDGLDMDGILRAQVRSIRRFHPVTGAPRRIDIYAHATTSFSAHGRSVSGHGAAPLFFEYAPDGTIARYISIGLDPAITIPGWGVILLDAGRLVIDAETFEVTFEAGPLQNWHEDYAGLCAYFTS